MDPYQPPEGDPGAVAQGTGMPPTFNPLAIVSLVCGLMSFLSCCCILFLPIPLVGGVLGGIAISQINANPHTQKGKEMAIAGIVLSVVIVLLWGLLFALQLAGALNPEMFEQTRGF